MPLLFRQLQSSFFLGQSPCHRVLRLLERSLLVRFGTRQSLCLLNLKLRSKCGLLLGLCPLHSLAPCLKLLCQGCLLLGFRRN